MGGRKMKLRLAADDIVVALLKFVGLEIQDKIFTSEREKIHRAIYFLKEKNPKVMAKFNFRNRGIFPESSELDQSLSNLKNCGLIEFHSVRPHYYKINMEKIDAVFYGFSQGLISENGIEISEVKELAKFFVERI